jgi:MFS family permease
MSAQTPDLSVPRHVLPVIVLSQFAGTSPWFSGNAILPALAQTLGMDGQAPAGITSAVHLGFIAGTLIFAVFNIADRWRPRDVFLVCALLGALANAAIITVPHLPAPYAWLLVLRFASGFFLAGIYPVGMKIAASWYRDGLGMALGYLVGALVIGTALPHLLAGAALGANWVDVALWVSLLTVAGGVLMHRTVPEGPYLAPAPRLDPSAVVQAFRAPQFRASASGYFGHMWELYSLWAFAPLLLAAYGAHHGVTLDASFWTFCLITAGGLGCMAGGLVSRRTGSARVALGALGTSGLCCLLLPLAFLLPPAGFLAFLMVWGVAVSTDSPQFSALNAATAPRAYVGSALTIVNCIGFTISVVSLQLMALLSQVLPPAWWFVPMALGPVLGVLVFRPLAAARR